MTDGGAAISRPAPSRWFDLPSSAAWKEARWLHALVRVPALLVLLEVAAKAHQPAAGVVSAGAAFSVGLVGSRRIGGSVTRAMVGTTLGMALSAWIGTLTGSSEMGNLAASALWGLGFAVLTLLDDDLGWIAMQAVIALVIASAFPSHGLAALERAGAILGGGIIQIAVVSALGWHALGSVPRAAVTEAAPQAQPPRPAAWPVFKTDRGSALAYALQMAATLIFAVEVSRLLHNSNQYWLPMTTIIVLKPDFRQTYLGAVQRVAGTVLGVSIASLLAHLFQPTDGWLFLLVALFSFAAFGLVRVHPILFAASLTAYVVFLIAFTGLPEKEITANRLILTAIGCLLALLTRLLRYQGSRRQTKAERPT